MFCNEPIVPGTHSNIERKSINANHSKHATAAAPTPGEYNPALKLEVIFTE
jgi:hypothetical protein